MEISKVSQKLAYLLIAAVLLFAVQSQSSTVQAFPNTVTIAGSLQKAVGCSGDWQPDCTTSSLRLDANDNIWKGSFTLGKGSYEYKATINGGWNENYGKNAKSGGDNIALTIANTGTVTFFYDDRTHWVTDDENSIIATAVGDFQSELGCSADNSPTCLRSWLEDPNGDGTLDFTTNGIPTGTYWADVTLDQTITTTLPTSKTFTVAKSGDAVTFVYSPTANSLTINSVSVAAEDKALTEQTVQHAFEDEILYFMLPDRFADGDTANNCGGYTTSCVISDTQENVLKHGYLPAEGQYYHGGDIKGITAKLDYIKGMGVTAIWVGPIFKNKVVQTNSSSLYGYGAGFHGYWITDFTQVDPHFGTNADFKAMVDAAHAKGIRVYMDIVTNHTADVIRYAENKYDYKDKANYPYSDTAGKLFDDLLYVGQANFPTLDLLSFPYTPVVADADKNIKVPAWLNDSVYYHNRGDTTYSGENSTYGDFVGLDDLFTERKEVVDGMVAIYKDWIDQFGIDGFRIDTAKHVNLEFWQTFGPEIVKAAKAKGINNFFAFGEAFSSDPTLLSHFTTKGKMQGTLDFAFQEKVGWDFVKGGKASNIKTFFANDDYFIDADSNAYAMPTFVSNHDRGRIGWYLRQNLPNAPEAELLERAKMAESFMFFGRGQPVIYYGDEQGFTGDGGDVGARQNMFANKVPSYLDDKLIGTTKTTADDNFDATHPIYQAVSKYAQLYVATTALRRGAQISRDTGNEYVFAFSRIERTEKVEYVVAFNNYTMTQEVVIPTYSPATLFNLILTDGASTADALQKVTASASGKLTIKVPATGFVIYQASKPTPTALVPLVTLSNITDGKVLTLNTKDLDGQFLTDRVELDASFVDSSMADTTFNEVTFAVKKQGDAAYTVIGTDDNPPYRVFYDASSLTSGTKVDFKVVVNNLAGQYATAEVKNVTINLTPKAQKIAREPYAYAVIHYNRPDGNYTDWGVHAWGDALVKGQGENVWDKPIPFLGQDSYGQFAYFRLADDTKYLEFIVHKGGTKDPDKDLNRKFMPSDTPQIWLKSGDDTMYASQAEAEGCVTVHYQRADKTYTGWGLHLWQGANTFTDKAMKAFDKPDDYGAYAKICTSEYATLDVKKPLNFIVHDAAWVKDPDGDRLFDPAVYPSIWLKSGDAKVYATQAAAENVIILHYHRDASDYGDPATSNYWGMHTWGDAADPGWGTPRKPVATDTFGVYFKVPLIGGNKSIGYILHQGNAKDPGPNQAIDVTKNGYELWQIQLPAGMKGEDFVKPYVQPIFKPTIGGGTLEKARAHWLTQDTIAWDVKNDYTFVLYYAANGGLKLKDGVMSGGQAITLSTTRLSDASKTKYPQLKSYSGFKIPATDLAKVPDMVKGQLAIAAIDTNGLIMNASLVQIYGVLDDLYTYTGDLGVVWNSGVPTIRLWAPTARSVMLHVFADPTTTVSQTIQMTAGDKGTWSAVGTADWKNKYYIYGVEVYVPSTGQVEHNMVTDPYALSLAMNSTRVQIVDLNDAALKPEGWDKITKPALAAPEDIVLYELHLRDFSVTDATVPTAERGTFKAFTEANSNGMKHLKALAQAGLTHIHLLPVFDIATINEDKTQWQAPNIPATFSPDSAEIPALSDAIRDKDGFNWGYDPFHYTVPEGSYSTSPTGTTRIVEFRQMVKALSDSGLRVVMDVVYNHTTAAGQAERSVLDKVVPGYYQRLSLDGAIETSTCCSNTASEHAMMEKLMVDSLKVWASAYKVDGFRFDLMGHHSKDNMVKVQTTLKAIDPSIYLYGEGWNFGEVENNARFTQATQVNMAGTGIGTFSDRLRDAVRGGGPFDSGAGRNTNQGFISGLGYDDSISATTTYTPWQINTEALLSADQIMVGLAGNLSDYQFIDRTGVTTTGKAVPYGGSPSGYNSDPQEHIIYIEAHDNETLYDISQYKYPPATSMANRVRGQNVGLSIVALSQGVPFFHAGMEMLRSKSLDRNSYNSGDWYNKLDFTYQTNNWGIGLPGGENKGEWPFMKPLLANPALKPTSANIQSAVANFQEMLKIRKSSPLFRLQTADQIKAMVKFHNTGPTQIPGLIVMSMADNISGTKKLDPSNTNIVVLFNANDESQTFTIASLKGVPMHLHSVQAKGHDAIVKSATFDSKTGKFYAPARTTAVFVDGVFVDTLNTINLPIIVKQK